MSIFHGYGEDERGSRYGHKTGSQYHRPGEAYTESNNECPFSGFAHSEYVRKRIYESGKVRFTITGHLGEYSEPQLKERLILLQDEPRRQQAQDDEKLEHAANQVANDALDWFGGRNGGLCQNLFGSVSVDTLNDELKHLLKGTSRRGIISSTEAPEEGVLVIGAAVKEGEQINIGSNKRPDWRDLNSSIWVVPGEGFRFYVTYSEEELKEPEQKGLGSPFDIL